MNLFEAGVLSAAPLGAAVGALASRPFGPAGMAKGAVAGLIAGIIAGWLYAAGLLLLIAMTSVLRRAARRRPIKSHSAPAMAAMTAVGNRGLALGALAAVLCWSRLGLPSALLCALFAALLTAWLAVKNADDKN